MAWAKDVETPKKNEKVWNVQIIQIFLPYLPNREHSAAAAPTDAAAAGAAVEAAAAAASHWPSYLIIQHTHIDV